MINKIKHQLMDFNCGSATSKINIYTGGLFLEAPLFSVGGGNLHFGLSLQYQSNIASNLKEHIKNKTHLPNNWKLNVHHILIRDDLNDTFTYHDDKGFEYKFIKYKTNTYFDDAGSGLTLSIDPYDGCTVTDLHQNEVSFNASYQVVKITSGINNYMHLSYIYNEGKLVKIRNSRSRAYTIIFGYSGEQLVSIYTIGGDIGVDLIYENDVLVGIKEFFCNNGKTKWLFKYGNNSLAYIISEGKEFLKFTYDNHLVSKIDIGIAGIIDNYKQEGSLYYLGEKLYLGDDIFVGEKSIVKESDTFNFSDGRKTAFYFTYFNNYKTTVQEHSKYKLAYFFNKKGTVISVLEETSEGIYKTFHKTNALKLYDRYHPFGIINNKNLIRVDTITHTTSHAIGIETEKIKNFNDATRSNEYNGIKPYEISFWIRFNHDYNQSLQATLEIVYTSSISESFDMKIDATPVNSWQYVQIPIHISHQNNAHIIQDMTIYFEGAIDIAVTDISISPTTEKVIHIDGVDIKEIDELIVKDKNNITQTISMNDSNNYMTEHDLFQTYMHININHENFDLMMNHGEKRINVKKCSFVYQNQTYDFSMNQGIPNFNVYSRVSQGGHTFLLSKKAYTFKETHYEIHEIKDTVIGHDNFNISSNTSNFVKIYYNGLIKASCSNGLVTEYLYDAYGNIEKEIIHEQAEPSNIINEITYAYDNVIPLGRENPIYIVQNDERIDFEYHPISKRIISETTSHIQKTYSYDLFQNHVIDESIIENDQLLKQVKYNYDGFGLVKNVYADTQSTIIRDTYQKVIKHYHANQLVLQNIIGEDYHIDRYHLNGITIDHGISYDKYNRLRQITNMGKAVVYRYQDDGNPYHVDDPRYNIYQFEESPLTAGLTQIIDPYENTKYTYHYDRNSNLYGYDNGNSIVPIEVMRINGTDLSYTYGPDKNHTRLASVIHDESHQTPYVMETNDSFNEENIRRDFKFKYTYTNETGSVGILDRIKTVEANFKHNEDQAAQLTAYDYKNANQILDKVTTTLIQQQAQHQKTVITTNYHTENNEITIEESIVKYAKNAYNEYEQIGQEDKDITFSYDKLGRISYEVKGDGTRLDYTYLGSTNKLLKIHKNQVLYKNYTYDQDKLTHINSHSVVYDSDGYMISFKGMPIVYDTRGFIVEYGSDTYYYNHKGIRYKKETPNGYSLYYYDDTRLLAEAIYELDNNTYKLKDTMHFFYNALGIAGISYKGIKYNYVLDAYGHVSQIHKDGRLIGAYSYDAFGNHEIVYYTTDTEEIALLNNNPFRWKGYYQDVDTQIIWIGKVPYNKELGEWLSEAFIQGMDSQMMRGISLYPYMGIDPVVYLDSSGNSWESYWKTGIGFVAATALLAVTAVAVVASGGTLLIPALIGAGIGAGTSVIGQGVGNMMSGKGFFDDFSVESVFFGTIAGAAFATGVGGLFGAIGIGAVSNGGLSAMQQQSWTNIGIGALVGGAAAGVGYGLGKLVSTQVFKNSDVVFSDIYQMTLMDTNKFNAVMIAFASTYYTFIPSATNGAARAVINYLNKLRGE